MPVIYVFSQVDDPDAFCLLPDDEGGAALATQHLIDLGRRRIAHVTGPERFEAVRLRRARLPKDARRRRDRTRRTTSICPASGRRRGGARRSRACFAGAKLPPDALFCGNDQIARGAADALRERGIAVPDGVSIVGFDNWEVMAEASRPPLTSVDMNLKDLGRRAGQSLLERIRGKRLRGVERLPCTLVVRRSCGADLPSTPVD